MEITEAPMSGDEIIVRLSHLARTAKSESLQLRALGMLMRHYGMLSPAKASRPPAPAAALKTPAPAQATPVAKAAASQPPQAAQLSQAAQPSQAALRPHLMPAGGAGW